MGIAGALGVAGVRPRTGYGLSAPGAARSRHLDRHRAYRIAVLMPMSGSAGIWGPSCISCAQLAIQEVNGRGGIDGRLLEPVFLNSDDGLVEKLEWELYELVEEDAISAIVSMSVSSVRQRLNKLLAGRVPHVYTPLYEGNEHSPNVFTIGETPTDQLVPAIRRLTETLKVRRWALIGNDYVWPRSSNAIAKESIATCGGQVTFEGYVPFGLEEPVWLVERIVRTRPDIILVSLVGQDSVEFNRVFGEMGLHQRIFRFSTAIEENVLMATGAANTKRLFAAAAYFANLGTDQNLAFKERYHSMHRSAAPALNSLGQSLYEGISFYAALANRRTDAPNRPVRYASARGGVFYGNDRKDNPTYLSRADSLKFAILETLG